MYRAVDCRADSVSQLPQTRAAAFFRMLAPALIVALAVFGLGVLLEALVRQNDAGPWWGVLDQALIAVIAGSIVYCYERQRRRAEEERLRLVHELAEQIRDAAHIIDYFVHHTGTADLDRNVANSLERIHWALRELVPTATGDLLHPQPPLADDEPSPAQHVTSA